MELTVLDSNFLPVERLKAVNTMIWERRDATPGIFEVHCGVTDFPALHAGAYLYRSDRDELGIIYEADTSRNEAGAQTCYAKGYFAEQMLYDRVVERTWTAQDEAPDDIARELVTDFFINARTYTGRSVNRIELAPYYPLDLPPTSVQATGKTVGDVLTSIESDIGMAHRLAYNWEQDKLMFSLHKGANLGAIFGDEWGNVITSQYHIDRTDAPNVVFVAGAGEGQDRKVCLIDLRESPDEYAREMYVDARDIQQSWEEQNEDTGETKTYYYDDATYMALLQARGMQKLEGHKVLESFSINANPKANLRYREDYDVGDWATIRLTLYGGHKIEVIRQITAVREVYQDGQEKLTITFGSTGPVSLKEYFTATAQVNVSSTAAGVGDLSKLDTEEKGSLVKAINEVAKKTGSDKRIGELDNLKTASKDTVVDAVNEVAEDVEAAEEDIGDTEEMDVDIPPELLDPGSTEEKAKDLTEAVNALQKQIGTLSELSTEAKNNLVSAINEAATTGGGGGSGGGGEDERIGDMANLKTAKKDLIVDAINELFNGGASDKRGIVVAGCNQESAPSGATLANFFGSGQFNASSALSVNVATVGASAPADGGAVTFSATQSSFCAQGNKTITMVPGLPVFGMLNAKTASVTISSKKYDAPMSLRGAAFLVDMYATVNSVNTELKATVPCDLVNGTQVKDGSKYYMAYIPKPVGLPNTAGSTISNPETIGPETAGSPFTYFPFIPCGPKAAGNRLVVGFEGGEKIFMIDRSNYVAALFTCTGTIYGNSTRRVSKMEFAGLAKVTSDMSFVSWLSEKHR